MRNLILAALSVLFAVAPCTTASSAETYDIVIYGGTSGAVAAAVQARRMGKSVVIVCPDKHLGGLTRGGLGWTDSGDKSVIGGLAREFYHRVWQHYQMPEAWKWQRREEYGNRGQGTPAIDGEQRTMWIFEPHVAEQVFEEFVAEWQYPGPPRPVAGPANDGVETADGRIRSITMLSGQHLSRPDLHRRDLRRRSDGGGRRRSTTWAGNRAINTTNSGTACRSACCIIGITSARSRSRSIPTWCRATRPAGCCRASAAKPPGQYGAADKKVQAYCFRMCLTNHPENRVPFPRPEDYDPGEYELLSRIFAAGWRETFNKFDPIPNRKTDTNNHGPFSTDNIGYNYDYPEASYERRREIIREHERTSRA